MAVIGIIPARYASTRFPGKPLALLAGVPMVQHVYERAQQATLLDGVIVATDDARIRDAVLAFGGRVAMTSPDHATGTDRLAEVARALPDAGIIINLQGDEPLIDPATIDAVVRPLLDDPSLPMSSAMAPLDDPTLVADPNVVKVVVDGQGDALYFSRAAIPYIRDVGAPLVGAQTPAYWKHIGLYGYRRDFLLAFPALSPTPLERLEKLEQLRALEHGYRIRMVALAADNSYSVDTPEDLERVKAMFATKG